MAFVETHRYFCINRLEGDSAADNIKKKHPNHLFFPFYEDQENHSTGSVAALQIHTLLHCKLFAKHPVFTMGSSHGTLTWMCFRALFVKMIKITIAAQ